ncbi:hypothetical protein ACV4WP_28265 [Pseudomonas aeruginosa]|uniref:hypothetical protein n=1 Tax=Pseudomonas aeruginosa TaxID=287 RepID=UPI001243A079|nr:hypothetical protein [Pseudomonas aeruginosa]KAB0773150.1 hypothetical protein F7P00_22415 [Pseudomonas aeruginosa]
MEKAYRLMIWLDMGQALSRLRSVTGLALSENDLIELCASWHCNIYVDADDLRGFSSNDYGIEVLGSGVHSLHLARTLKGAQPDQPVKIYLTGPVFFADRGDDEIEEHWDDWTAQIARAQCKIVFRPSDIEALAASLNGADSLEDDAGTQLTESLLLSRFASVGLPAIADATGNSLSTLQATHLGDIQRWSKIMDLLGLRIAYGSEPPTSSSPQVSPNLPNALQTDENREKPIDRRERATYERLIYVLAKEAGYRLEKPTADEVMIQKYAASIGAKAPSGKGTIADKLKAAVARAAEDNNDQRPYQDSTDT